MKNTFLLKLTFLLLIGCTHNSNHFENEELKIEELNGYKLDSIREGAIPIKVNGKTIESENYNQTQYVISKDEIANTNNYLKIRLLNLNDVSEEEYLKALLNQLPENYPPFSIEKNVHDTIVNMDKGHAFLISIDLGNKKMEQSILVLKSKTSKTYELISTVIDNNETVKNDFKNIISKMTIK